MIDDHIEQKMGIFFKKTTIKFFFHYHYNSIYENTVRNESFPDPHEK